jgi:hypothetical protein
VGLEKGWSNYPPYSMAAPASRNDVASLYNPAFSGTFVHEEQSNQKTREIRVVRFLQFLCFSGRLADGYLDFCTSRCFDVNPSYTCESCAPGNP